jgi:hypothetical protein
MFSVVEIVNKNYVIDILNLTRVNVTNNSSPVQYSTLFKVKRPREQLDILHNICK